MAQRKQYNRFGDELPDEQEIAKEKKSRRTKRILFVIGAILAVAFVGMVPISRFYAYHYGSEKNLEIYRGYRAIELGMTAEQLRAAVPKAHFLHTQPLNAGYEYSADDSMLRMAQSRAVLICMDEAGRVKSVEFIWRYGKTHFFNHLAARATQERYQSVEGIDSLAQIEKALGKGLQVFKSAGEQRYVWSDVGSGESIVVVTDGDDVQDIVYTPPVPLE